MKRTVCLCLVLFMMLGMIPVFGQEEAAAQTAQTAAGDLGELLDDCVDFSAARAHSEELYCEVTAEENRYAFDDYTMIMRKTATAQWLEYEIPDGQYLTFHTYFRQGEEISHFSFSWSKDGETWQDAAADTEVVSVDSWKWVPVIYRLKHLDASAKYVKITFGNLTGSAWSPSLAGVYSNYIVQNPYGFADCAGTPYEKDTSFLKSLGFVSGYSAQKYCPTEEISRAELAQLTAKAISASGGARVFWDVEREHWAASAVAGLYGMGVICGDENGYFHPDDPVTCIEAAKIFCAAMGYTAMAEQHGGYPTGFWYMARQIGLLDGVNRAQDETLCRGDAAIMLSNMLRGEMLVPIRFGGEESSYEKNGTTPLSYYHHIREVKGQLTNLGARSIGDALVLDEDQAIVGNETFAQTFSALGALMGQNIIAYVKTDPNRENGTILYAEAQTDSVSTAYTAAEFRGIAGQKLVFWKDGAEVTYSYHNNTRVIYNGRYETRMGLLTELKLDCGRIRLVSLENEKRVDIIFVEEYTVYQMRAPGRLAETVTDKNLGAVRLGIDDAQSVSVFRYGEEENDPSGTFVNTDDMVFAAKSRDGLVLDIQVLHEKREGVLQALDQSEYQCTLEGETLFAERSLWDGTLSAMLGKEVCAYLDIEGAIVRIEEQSEKGGYGYLQAVSLETGVSAKTRMRIVSQSGTAEEYIADSSTRLDGNKVGGTAFAALSPQLILYRVRENGVLSKVETAGEVSSVGQNGFVRNYRSDRAKYYGDNLKVFDSVYQVSDATKVFMIPKDHDAIEDYEVTAPSALMTDKDYAVSLYDVDSNYHCGAAVVDLANSEERSLENYDPVAIITEVAHIFDKDQNPCLKVSAKVGGADAEIYFDTNGAEDVTGSWLPGYQSRITENGNNPFFPGEVMQYYMDAKSHCKYFRMFLTKDMIQNGTEYEKNMGDYGALSVKSYFSEVYTVFGTVADRFSDKLLVTNGANGYLRTIPLGGAQIYRLKTGDQKLLMGDAADLVPDSRIFVRMNYTAVREIVVIED